MIRKSLNDKTNTLTIVAGTGVYGFTPSALNYPIGIFVDINFDLYVADSDNNRIQLFRSGETNGITVAGSGSSLPTLSLGLPSGVVLDADKYLFIADYGNNRIVGQGPNGFRCLVACSGTYGSSSNTLSSPQALRFDSYGNIFVVDAGNNRIQKFVLISNSCSELI